MKRKIFVLRGQMVLQQMHLVSSVSPSFNSSVFWRTCNNSNRKILDLKMTCLMAHLHYIAGDGLVNGLGFRSHSCRWQSGWNLNLTVQYENFCIMSLESESESESKSESESDLR